MSQRIKHRISPDRHQSPKKDSKYVGVDGYSAVNDFVFTSDIEAWSMGKYRRGKKESPSLF